MKGWRPNKELLLVIPISPDR